MMVEKGLMRLLIQKIHPDGAASAEWTKRILEAIPTDSLPNSGFSEFETYGNFLAKDFPDRIICRNVPSFRQGAQRYGMDPNEWDLWWLERRFFYASFEAWNVGRKRRIAFENTCPSDRLVVEAYCIILPLDGLLKTAMPIVSIAQFQRITPSFLQAAIESVRHTDVLRCRDSGH